MTLTTPTLGLFIIHHPLCSTRHSLSNKEKTKSLASSVEKLRRVGSQNLKSRSRDHGHALKGCMARVT